MTLVGLSLAVRTSGRSEYELLAQAVDEVLPLYRDGTGGFYFAPSDLAETPRRVVCAVKGCGRTRKRGMRLCLCPTHHRRYLTGKDLTARIRVEHTQRGEKRRERTGERMRPVVRPGEAEARYSAMGGGYEEHHGAITTASIERRENRQAEQLGTPEMWQQVADEALERAWQDLISGAFESRLKARLASLCPSTPKTVQSPLVSVVKP